MPPKTKPLLQSARFRLLSDEYKLEEGTKAELDRKAADLPFKEYIITTPFLGQAKMYLGRPDKAGSQKDIEFIIRIVLSGEFKKYKEKIEALVRASGEIQVDILQKIYINLEQNDKSALEKIKPALSSLVRFGAIFHHLEICANSIFSALVNHGLDGNAISIGLVARQNPDNQRFENYASKLDLFLSKGADLNVSMHRDPNFGSYLSYYLAMEYKDAAKLIELLYTKCKTKFLFDKPDGFGNTPLLLALYTLNEKAALALLNLEKSGIKVGINKPCRFGRTPLQLAAALGLGKVYESLLSLEADPTTKDKQGDDLNYYHNLTPTDIKKLLEPYMNSDRADLQTSHQHSQLYLIDYDKKSFEEVVVPACFYEDGIAKTGEAQAENFVYLSNEKDHYEKIDRVIALLKEAASQGDHWAIKQLPYVIKQVDDIRFSAKFCSIITLFHERRTEPLCSKLLEYVNAELLEGLFKERLDKLIIYCENLDKKVYPEVTRLISNLTKYKDEKSNLPRSILAQVLITQKLLRESLQNKLKTPLLRAKEKYLRRACALGDVVLVKELLADGANPNNRDHLARSAVFYAIMRSKLVRTEIRAAAAEKGFQEPSDLDEQVEKAMQGHAAVLEVLKEHPSIDFKAQNANGLTVKALLERDSTDEETLTKETAIQCMLKISNLLETKAQPKADEAASSTSLEIR